MNGSTADVKSVWISPVVRIGTITMMFGFIVNLLPSVYLYTTTGIFPSVSQFLSAWTVVLAFSGAFYVIEPVTYYAVLGLSGTYMSFLTGNITNLRVPASATAQEAVGVEPGTPKAEIISTLGICGSVITNTVAITIAAIFSTVFLKLMPQSFVLALSSYTLPSIFAAIFIQTAMRNYKIGLIALPIPILLLVVIKALPFAVNIVLCVFLPIVVCRLLYKAGKL